MKPIHITLSILICFCSCLKIDAFPKQIMIVRHAEKFANAYDKTPFVTNGLTLKGNERATALAPYFMADPKLTKFGPPVAVYATTPDENYESLRPLETALPTAAALKLGVQQRSNEAAMVKEILENPSYDGKNVLLCWEHVRISNIVKALGVSPLPKPWPYAVFDWVYRIELDDNGKVSTFEILPQKLMYGDSETVS